MLTNKDHILQDIYSVREENQNRPRYAYAAELVPETNSSHKLLDVGGGRSEFLNLCASLGYKGHLLDGSESNVAHAKSLGFEATQADLNESLPFDDDLFEGAAMLDVIEHIVRAEQLVREIRRILKPGGFLVLSTPNVSSLGGRLAAVKGHPPRHEGYHYRFFNKYTLDALLTAADFKIINRNPVVGARARLIDAIWRRVPFGQKEREAWLARDLIILAQKAE